MAFGDDPVNDGSESDFGFKGFDCGDGAELQGFDLPDPLFFSFEALLEAFGRADVLLPDDPGLAVDALSFSQIIVGTTLEAFLKDIRHGKRIYR
jgi:hypothetical protein